MINLMITFFSLIIILVGLVSMLTPIPGGIVLIASGLTALICSSPTAQFCLMWIRSSANWFNKLFFWLEQKVGNKIKVIGIALAKTHPQKEGNQKMSHRDFIRKMKEEQLVCRQ